MEAHRASERLFAAELAPWLPLSVRRQRLEARAAGEGNAGIARRLLVDGRKGWVAELAQLCGFDREAVLEELLVIGGHDAFDLQGLESAFD